MIPAATSATSIALLTSAQKSNCAGRQRRCLKSVRRVETGGAKRPLQIAQATRESALLELREHRVDEFVSHRVMLTAVRGPHHFVDQ